MGYQFGDVLLHEVCRGIIISMIVPFCFLQIGMLTIHSASHSIHRAGLAERFNVGSIEIWWFRLGLPGVLLVAAAVGLELSGWMPRMTCLEKLGGAFCGIRVGHVFVIARAAIQPAGASGTLMHPTIFTLLAVLSSVGLEIYVHRVAERPLTALFGRLLGVA